MPRPQRPTATAADVLAGARATNARVTPRQLKRWRHEGLLPAPLFVEGKGRGEGVKSHYPPVAPLQAAVVAWLVTRVRRMTEVRWALWGLGFDQVTEGVRADLRAMLREERDAYLARHADHVRDDRDDMQKSSLEVLSRRHRRRPVHLDRVVRGVGHHRAPTYVALEHGMRLGLAEIGAAVDERDAELLANAVDALNALGVGRRRRQRRDPQERPERWREALRFVAEHLSFDRVDDLLATCDARVLRQLRNETDTLARYLGLISEQVDDVPTPQWFLQWFLWRYALGEDSNQMAKALRALPLPPPQPPPFLRRLREIVRGAKDLRT